MLLKGAEGNTGPKGGEGTKKKEKYCPQTGKSYI